MNHFIVIFSRKLQVMKTIKLNAYSSETGIVRTAKFKHAQYLIFQIFI
jgi:hypothetical protein